MTYVVYKIREIERVAGSDMLFCGNNTCLIAPADKFKPGEKIVQFPGGEIVACPYPSWDEGLDVKHFYGPVW